MMTPEGIRARWEDVTGAVDIALALGVDLDEFAAIRSRLDLPIRDGRQWAKSDTEAMKRMLGEREDLRTIGRRLGRSVGAIARRVRKMREKEGAIGDLERRTRGPAAANPIRSNKDREIAVSLWRQGYQLVDICRALGVPAALPSMTNFVLGEWSRELKIPPLAGAEADRAIERMAPRQMAPTRMLDRLGPGWTTARIRERLTALGLWSKTAEGAGIVLPPSALPYINRRAARLAQRYYAKNPGGYATKTPADEAFYPVLEARTRATGLHMRGMPSLAPHRSGCGSALVDLRAA